MVDSEKVLATEDLKKTYKPNNRTLAESHWRSSRGLYSASWEPTGLAKPSSSG